jgi:hypothetical protein
MKSIVTLLAGAHPHQPLETALAAVARRGLWVLDVAGESGPPVERFLLALRASGELLEGIGGALAASRGTP